jgi:hypothetical protein
MFLLITDPRKKGEPVNMKKLVVVIMLSFVSIGGTVTKADVVKFNRHCCMTEPGNFRTDTNPDNIRKRLSIYKSIGVDAIRTGVTPATRTFDTIVKEYDIMLHLCIGGPAAVFGYPGSGLVSHTGDETTMMSYWYPDFYKIAEQNFVDSIKFVTDAGLMDKIEYITPGLGPANESIYPAAWSTGLSEEKFWCYDKYAQEDFRAKMQAKYKDVNKANSEWETEYKSWQEVTVLKPGVKPGLYWNDVLFWYRDKKREFNKWMVSQVKKHFPNQKMIIYLPGSHITDEQLIKAIDTGDGEPMVRLMVDTDFLIDLASKNGSWVQYTGLEYYPEVEYIMNYIKDKGYDIQMWGENAGVLESAGDPANLANIIARYKLWGLDYTSSVFLFEPDGLTPNKIVPKLAEAYTMIKLAYSGFNVTVSPGDITKPVKQTDKISQEYVVNLVNNSDNPAEAAIFVDLPADWTVSAFPQKNGVRAGAKKDVRFTVYCDNPDLVTGIKNYSITIKIVSGSLEKDVVFTRNINLTLKKEATCYKLPNSINIDGDLSDWELNPDIIKNGVLIDKTCFNSGTYPNDYVNGMLYSGYDEDNIYFVIKVYNKEVTGKQSGVNIWQDDCLELWFDTSNKTDTGKHNMPNDPEKYQISIAPMTNDKVEPTVWVYRNPDEKVSKLLAEKTVVKSVLWDKDGDKGYVLEGKIPIVNLAGLDKIVSGNVVGFNASLVYKHTTSYAPDLTQTVVQRWNQRVWSGTNAADAATWGTLTFK